MKQKAFTLAEVMITLTVIGIITAVILPVAFHSKPDENIMKFKKAHNTFYSIISNLVNNENYYLDGDLGRKPDGSYIDTEKTPNDAVYLCNTIADTLTVKKVNCSKSFTKISNADAFYCSDWTSIEPIDLACKRRAKEVGQEIVLADGVVIYQGSPGFTFGYSGGWVSENEERTDYSDTGRVLYFHENASTGEAYRCSKTFCIDIDGFSDSGSDNCDDIKDICPFGYAVRVDGKITLGKRAKDWLEKNIQE